MSRRLLLVAGVVGAVLVAVAWVRRAGARRRERVDLYYADGSMVSLGDGSPEADRLLVLARDALRTVRA